MRVHLRALVPLALALLYGRIYDANTLDEIYPEARPLTRERPAESRPVPNSGIRPNGSRR